MVAFRKLFGFTDNFSIGISVSVVDLTTVSRVSFQFNARLFLFDDSIVSNTGFRMRSSLKKILIYELSGKYHPPGSRIRDTF